MKKFVFGIIFTFLTISIFGQIPNVVVSNFTSRARDVHEDDLVTVMEMFMNTLASGRTVNVIDRTVLERAMTAIEFGAGDWSDSAKTTRLGEGLNADYLVIGTVTQLGTSLTFSISVRDIKTLAVIASDQKQYTLENVWDNSVGIPAQLSDMGSTISSGINTEHTRRQQVIQAQLAAEQAERERIAAAERAERERVEADRRLGSWLVGSFWCRIGGSRTEYPGDHDSEFFELHFNSNGTFTGLSDRWPDRGAAYRANRPATREVSRFNGTYTREGTRVTLSYTVSIDQITWRVQRDRYVQSDNNSSTRSGRGSFVIAGVDSNSLSIQGDGFPRTNAKEYIRGILQR